MVHTFFAPEWFLTYELILHILFAVITFTVSFYAFKVYKLVKEPQPKLFGLAFASFFISYLFQLLLEFFTAVELSGAFKIIADILLERFLDILGVYIHIIFFTIGLVTLTFMTLNTKKRKVYLIILITSLLSLIFATNKVSLFYVLSSFFLLFILIHYVVNYFRHKQFNTFLAMTAFALLFLGSVPLIFSFQNELLYVTGHIIEGIAYVLILINLILVVKK